MVKRDAMPPQKPARSVVLRLSKTASVSFTPIPSGSANSAGKEAARIAALQLRQKTTKKGQCDRWTM
jgi:hypothetical protein